MARARNIKPSIFKNELLGEADPLLTILFEGLWCLADREGRLEDRPKRIKVEVFPYRDGINTDEMLDWLRDNSFITRYQIDNESYIQINKFHTHQKPHHMEAESIIPPMPGTQNQLNAKPLYKKQKERILERDNHQCVKCGAKSKLHIDHIVPVAAGGTSDDENLQVLCAGCNCSKGSRIVDDSLTNRTRIEQNASCSTDSLNTDSLNTDSGSVARNADAQRALSQDADSYKTKKGRKLNGNHYGLFEEFWNAFAYKEGKAEAADTWLDLDLDEKTVRELVIPAAKREAERRQKLIEAGRTPKMAQGWLSGRRFEDEDGVTSGPETQWEKAVRLAREQGLEPFQGAPYETPEQFMQRTGVL